MITVYSGNRDKFTEAIEDVFGSVNTFLAFIEADEYGTCYDVFLDSDGENYIINRETGEYVNWYKYTHVGRDLHATVNPDNFIEFLTKFKFSGENIVDKMLSNLDMHNVSEKPEKTGYYLVYVLLYGDSSPVTIAYYNHDKDEWTFIDSNYAITQIESWYFLFTVNLEK